VYVVSDNLTHWDGSLPIAVAAMAMRLGLIHSANMTRWDRKRKWHIQLRQQETPLLIRGFIDSWAQLDAEMQKRFL